MKRAIVIAILLLAALHSYGQSHLLDKWSKESDPVILGNILSERFLSQPNSVFGRTVYNTPPTHITYPDVCAWLGALWFAQSTDNRLLTKRLMERFDPVMNKDSHLQPIPNHVDVSVFGALPLEIYKISGDKKLKKLGIKYADAQWQLPKGWTLTNQPKRSSEYYGMLSDAHISQPEQKMWADKGYSWQTRMWLDDMFMITTLQAQAFTVTGDRKYIDRAAREMVAYMDSIQLDNGLFDHSPGVPYRWARGNGWMAVGFTELLRILPEDNPHREYIMAGYKKMMASLLKYQSDDGMWHQLIDDGELWYETSGSAMFAYAFIVGVKKRWLQDECYARAARKAWIALTRQIEPNGDVRGVCEGTNIKNDRQHYIDRERVTGDLHGQAPLLWCAYALCSDFK